MIITIDTTQPLTELERNILSRLLGLVGSFLDEVDKVVREVEPEPTLPIDKGDTEGETAQPRVAANYLYAALREIAVAKATELLSSGQATKVREALATAGGARKVSELADDQLQAFVDAL